MKELNANGDGKLAFKKRDFLSDFFQCKGELPCRSRTLVVFQNGDEISWYFYHQG